VAKPSKAASGQRRSRKRSQAIPTPTVPLPERLEKIETSSGLICEVGSEYQVLHYSSQLWKTEVLKRIERREDDSLWFTFFHLPPGWITVGEDRIREIPTKGKRRKKKDVIED
jgi:hypothetical protein